MFACSLNVLEYGEDAGEKRQEARRLYIFLKFY